MILETQHNSHYAMKSANTSYEDRSDKNDPQGSCKVKMVFMAGLPTEVISQVELKRRQTNPVHCTIIKVNYEHFGDEGMSFGELRKWADHARRKSSSNGDVPFVGMGSQTFPIYEVVSFDAVSQVARASPIELSARSRVAFPGPNNEMMILLANRPSSIIANSKRASSSGAQQTAGTVAARASYHMKLNFVLGSMLSGSGKLPV